MFEWIKHFSDWLIYSVFNIVPGSRLGEALNFFVYDTLKILLLLFIITVLMGIINAYFPIERLRSFLAQNKLYGLEYFMASIFGAVTPFCSCSSVPLFIGFVQARIPLGVTFSFLITSPLVNEVALALFIGMFGWKITIIYAITGVFLGAIGGKLLGMLRLEDHLTDWVKKTWKNSLAEAQFCEGTLQTFWQRLPGIARGALSIVRSVVPYIIVGIAIGAAMHGYVPENFFHQYLSNGQWWAVPVAVVLAVPIYTNAAGIIPIVQVLVAKGVSLGTALAFMMGTVGLSLPEAALLKKVMTVRLIAIYFGVVSIFIIISGFLFNLIM